MTKLPDTITAYHRPTTGRPKQDSETVVGQTPLGVYSDATLQKMAEVAHVLKGGKGVPLYRESVSGDTQTSCRAQAVSLIAAFVWDDFSPAGTIQTPDLARHELHLVVCVAEDIGRWPPYEEADGECTASRFMCSPTPGSVRRVSGVAPRCVPSHGVDSGASASATRIICSPEVAGRVPSGCRSCYLNKAFLASVVSGSLSPAQSGFS